MEENKQETSKELLEQLKSMDNVISVKRKLLELKAYLEIKYKDNKVLQEYLDVLHQLDDVAKEESNYKSSLYEQMSDEKCKNWEGDNVKITLKEAYTKKQIDSKFFEDNKEGSRLYRKYVKIVPVKGNIVVTYKED